MATKVLIVDNHPVFLYGLRSLLKVNKDLEIVGEAKNRTELFKLLNEESPEIIIMNVSLPNFDAIEVANQIHTLAKNTKILAIAENAEKGLAKPAMEAGINGFILKNADPADLTAAIHEVIIGREYLDPSISSFVLNEEMQSVEAEDQIILQTRLHRPPIADDFIYRTKVIDRLNKNLSKPFSLISAPAGYGKSVTVSQWLEKSGTLYSWISLEEEHNNLRIFLLYFKEAMENIIPGSLKETSQLFSSAELPPLKVISDALINELDAIDQDFIIVLDDYHRIHEEKIHLLIDAILRFPPQRMHLSIITRKDPPLRLNTLLLHSRMTEVRMSDLSFSNEEIEEFFMILHGYKLKDETTSLLHEKTEGWIVGLRMAILSIESQEDANIVLQRIVGDTNYFSKYLLEEIFNKQSSYIQEMLLITSCLNRFCADLVEEIQNVKSTDEVLYSGNDFINWLVKSNLFIIPLDNQNKWFRYHHLIQQLFMDLLGSKKSAKEISKIYFRAANWFELHGFTEEAINYMLAGGHPDEACHIVENHRWRELDNDRWYILHRWLELLPEEQRRNSPELLLSEAWGAYENFQLEKIPVLIEMVRPLLKDNKKDQGLSAECDLMMGLVFHWSGMGEKALQYFQKALEYLPEDWKLAQGMLHLHIALARSVTGNKDLALQGIREQLSVDTHDPISITRLMAGTFYVNQFAGDLKEARNESRQIQKLAKTHNLIYTYAMGICMEATSCFNAYELNEALDLFTVASQNRYNLHLATALDAMAGKVITHQFLENPGEADKSLEQLESFEKEMNRSGNTPVSKSCRARLSLLRGEISSAIEWEKTINETPSFASLFIWLEVPNITQARVLIAEGSELGLKKASKILKELRSTSEELHLANQIIEINVLQAVLLEKQDKHDQAFEILKDVLILAEPGGWIQAFLEAGPIMLQLLIELKETGYWINHLGMILSAFENSKLDSTSSDLIQIQDSQPGELKDLALTTREIEIIKLIGQGLRNKELAQKLFISEGTIKKHIYNVCQKMNVHNRINLVHEAGKLGYI